ncbi:MAG: MerC domain-containing protein [Bdellovibrionales bacterium]|nr:MerC domain-containing protein [Bdellovibrionales bacterium]
MNIEGHNEIDKIGISLSGLCAIHCLITPLILIFMPAWANFFKHEYIHILFFLTVSPLALISFYRVFKEHEDRVPLGLGILGSLVLLLSFVEHDHDIHFLSILGSILLMSGHFLSLKKCRCKQHAH